MCLLDTYAGERAWTGSACLVRRAAQPNIKCNAQCHAQKLFRSAIDQKRSKRQVAANQCGGRVELRQRLLALPFAGQDEHHEREVVRGELLLKVAA